MNAVTGVEGDKSHCLPNKISVGHQVDIYSSQAEPSALAIRESRRHHGDAIYKNLLNRNNKPKNRLTKMSANPQKWSTKMYSPEQAPKEPDKEKWHAQKGAQVMEPIDIWTSYSSWTNPEVQEARQCRSDKAYTGHQMAIPSYQRKLSGNWHVLPYRESRQRQRDTAYRRWLFTNNEYTRQAEDPSGMDKEQGMGDMHVL
jgi:hypothetical protein